MHVDVGLVCTGCAGLLGLAVLEDLEDFGLEKAEAEVVVGDYFIGWAVVALWRGYEAFFGDVFVVEKGGEFGRYDLVVCSLVVCENDVMDVINAE